MAPRLVRSSDLVRVPWKNGGGTTAEIAVHPPGADLDRFDWRISMADVGGDGPFSRFPGIDRTLVLAEGRDLVLAVDGRRHRLERPGDAVSFSGEADTVARLGCGPIRDINVMSRRGRFVHQVGRWTDRASGFGAGAAALAIVALGADAEVSVGGRAFRLAPLDLMLLDRWDDGLAVTPDALAIALLSAAP